MGFCAGQGDTTVQGGYGLGAECTAVLGLQSTARGGVRQTLRAMSRRGRPVLPARQVAHHEARCWVLAGLTIVLL